MRNSEANGRVYMKQVTGKTKLNAKKVLVLIPIFLLLILSLYILIPEVYFRIYFHNLFIENPFPHVEPPIIQSSIPGVPFLQVDFSEFGLNKTQPRIIVLGDYITFRKGWGDQKTYCEILDEKLNYSHEIINTGGSFYSVSEEINLLKNKALEYNPDIVVLGYIFNDIDPNIPDNVLILLQLKKDIYEFKIITPLAIAYLDLLYDLENVEQVYSEEISIMDYWDSLYRNPESFSLLNESLSELKQIKDEGGIRVIFVIIPIFYDWEDETINESIQYINDLIYDECLEYELDCVNMLDIFKNYGLMEVKEDDGNVWHPNSFGNELIAEEIYKMVISNT